MNIEKSNYYNNVDQNDPEMESYFAARYIEQLEKHKENNNNEILLDRICQLTVRNNMMQEALEEIQEREVDSLEDGYEIRRFANRVLDNIS